VVVHTFAVKALLKCRVLVHPFVLEVLLAAGDTFRAAAAEQLQTWAERSGAEFFGPQRENQRPDALLYQARPWRLPL
jgi:signal recognition particle GTPase